MLIDGLSDDALSAAVLFHSNPGIELTFNTPQRIHPRMRAALDALIGAGVLQEKIEQKAAAETRRFSVKDRKKLAEVPRQSLREQKRVGLPIVVNDHKGE